MGAASTAAVRNIPGALFDRRAGGSLLRRISLLVLCLTLSGCGLAAAPCRVGSAALKIVPVIGHAAATPTDACANAIDPG